MKEAPESLSAFWWCFLEKSGKGTGTSKVASYKDALKIRSLYYHLERLTDPEDIISGFMEQGNCNLGSLQQIAEQQENYVLGKISVCLEVYF